jgi:toxin ParE1/3/4
MSLPLVIRSAAQAEFDAAAVWYEGQRVGLGVDFVAEVQRTLDTISNQPDQYPVVLRDVREAPVARFPYCVYYRVKPDRIVMIAVFHSSRDPSIWQSGPWPRARRAEIRPLCDKAHETSPGCSSSA